MVFISSKVNKIRNKSHKLFKRLSRLPLASLNYHLKNYDDVIWVVGDGRSGTTWLGDLINYDKRYRELFETIHPFHVKQTRDYGFNPYLRANDTHSPLCQFLTLVFDGKFKHFRADVSKPQCFFKGLLIKEIYANLLIAWVHKNIPKAKKVLIIRNPFSVALSKQRHSNWIWMLEPKDFLHQEALMKDYLEPFESLINSTKDDFIDNQILIWAIIHYVPFKQLNKDDLHIIFYENLLLNPEGELLRLLNYLHSSDSVCLNGDILKLIQKPSRTTSRRSSTLSTSNPLDAWKSHLSVQQIDRGMKILNAFGLASIYAGNSIPAQDESQLFDFPPTLK